jgi:XTP/dITP diphosphohydrolase
MLPGTVRVAGLQDLDIQEEIEESGTTIADNSRLKAQFLKGRLPDCDLIIADDSGLEVEALGGAPGVYSARYAGEPKSDEANNRKLLHELSHATNRKARFVTVITLIDGGEVHVFEGEVRGTIAHEPRGVNGFGYDPLFIPTGYRSTFAELGAEVKNAISHRAAAMKKLLAFLGPKLS